MQAVVVGWRMYEITHNPLSLGLIGLAEAVPALGLALYAGYLIDRSPPLRIYITVLYGSLISSLMLLLSHSGAFIVSNTWIVDALYIASFITGTARAFSQPAMYSIIPRLVPRESLARATGISSSSLQTARILGPALGGIFYGFLGALPTFIIICLMLAVALFFGHSIRAKVSAPSLAKKDHNVWEELASGVKFVFSHRILLPALTLDMVSVLFGGVTALLPIFAEEILKTGPTGLGLLRTAPSIGAVFVGLYFAKTSLMSRAGTWLLTAVAGFGFCILLFSMSTSFPLSLIALILSGAFDGVSMIIRSTAVQLVSPDHMRGRISAVNSMFIGSSNELGELESGIAAHFLGTVPAAILGGAVCLLTVSTVALLSPTLRKMDLEKI